MTELPDPLAAVRTEGRWTHRDVAANAARFHVVEAGEGPTVVLLHGFPTFWWTWRRQLLSYADAGYRVVAMDLRGYGGSDHSPHGYDPFTLAADVSGVIRSLGASDAVLIGHGWGGLIAWTAAALHPEVVRAIAPVGMAHPAPLRAAMVTDSAQRRAGRYTIGFQRPFIPEHQLTAHNAARIGRYLRRWSATAGWPSEEEVATYRAAMLLPASAHCAVEYHRWALRSIPRRDGRRFVQAMSRQITQPVLQIHGSADPAILPSTVDGSEKYATAYERVNLATGHFPHEEDPAAFDAAVLPWLDKVFTDS